MRNALITGSTSGIGLAIAEKMAKEGINVIINGFGSEEQINEVIDKIKKHKVKVLFYGIDISDSNAVQEMVSDIQKKLSTIDILVNNAGIQHVSPIEEFSVDMWNKVISINLSSAFYLTKYILPVMKQNNFGRIINIASAHGKVASANKAAYVAAKHAIVGLSKVIALETAKLNITSNCICPGWVLTPLVEAQIENIAKENSIPYEQAKIKLLSEKQPSLQFVKPGEIADLAHYLCSESASQITGTEISIDGGWTAV